MSENRKVKVNQRKKNSKKERKTAGYLSDNKKLKIHKNFNPIGFNICLPSKYERCQQSDKTSTKWNGLLFTLKKYSTMRKERLALWNGSTKIEFLGIMITGNCKQVTVNNNLQNMKWLYEKQCPCNPWDELTFALLGMVAQII